MRRHLRHGIDADANPKKTMLKTLRRVWQYARPYPGLMVGTFLCAALSTGAGFVFARATGLVIDKVLVPHRPELLLPYVLLVAVSFLFRDVLDGFRIWFNNTFEQKVILALRRDLYNKLQRLPLKWYDQRSTGDIITRVIDDVTNMERVLIDGVEQSLTAIIQVVGIGVMLFLTNAYLAFWMLLPIPILTAGSIWFARTAKSRWKAQREAASDMNSLLVDNLQGVRLIKSYAREETEMERFSKAAEAMAEGQLKVMRIWAVYTNLMGFMGSLGVPIVLYIGGLLYLNASGTMSPGDLVTFVLYVSMFYQPIGQLHQMNQMYQAGRASGDRVNEILEAEEEAYQKAGAAPSTKSERLQGRVEYRNVAFAYREDIVALADINIKVEPGQMVALVGHTGAGKTTFAALLNRFYEVTQGAILLDGRDIRSFGLEELRQQIGLVSQETFLFNGTVIDNLKFAQPTASRAEILAAAEAARVDDFVKRLPEGYDTQVGERGVKLSVGEKQRISIARALLKNAPILILDEATASVDTVTERLIQEALSRLLKGRTSFVIAHRLSTVREADMILVLKSGRVLEQGNHGELMRLDGTYADLIRKQSDPWADTLSAYSGDKGATEAEIAG